MSFYNSYLNGGKGSNFIGLRKQTNCFKFKWQTTSSEKSGTAVKTYGKTRRRLETWKRDQKSCSSSKWGWTNNGFGGKCGYAKNSLPEDNPTEVPKKPELPKKATGRQLLVEDVDLNISENVASSKTAEYECTQDRFDDDDKYQPAELVVRRGNFMKFTLTFDQPYSKEKHNLKLCFKIGKTWSVSRGTMAMITLDEDGVEVYEPDEWGAYLRSRSGNSMDVMIHIPASCIVGEWTFTVMTILEGGDETKKEDIAEYQHDDDIKIIFNPWCKDDEVYMEQSDLLDEYILNESGCVYRGTAWKFSPKPWNFGQFEDEVLDICLYLLRRAFKVNDKMAPGMADPIEVSRKLVAMINCNDDDGVLFGNWSGDYSGGIKPTKWISSVPILKKFMAEGPVRYGQCWVFSCVTTTVFRCLGIPCRTVTNFASAHDENCTNVIERAHIITDDNMYPISDTNESIWNFHVWNEVWFSRPDLDNKEYSGWQVVDATPQEESSGVMTCGPCPVRAVKEGQVDVDFDTAFVYSEVNADVATFKVNPDGSAERLCTDKTSVGKNISTKRPDGKPFVFDVFDKNRLDLTNEYKYPEGSAEEREASRLAYKLAKNHHKKYIPYPKSGEEEKIKMKLIHSNDVMFGQELEISVSVTNNDSIDREILRTNINISAMTYDGQTGPSLMPRRFDSITLCPDEEVSFSIVVEANEYYRKLVDQENISIQAVCVLAPAFGSKNVEFMKTHVLTFQRPDLDVVGPTTGKVGEEVEFEVSFSNPLDMALTNCEVSMDSPGFRNIADKKERNVRPNGQYCGKFRMKPKRVGTFQVTFTFESREFDDITGSQTIVIS